MNLWRDYMSLWQSSMLRMLGAPALPVAEPAKGDKRFKDAGLARALPVRLRQAVLPDHRALAARAGRERRGPVASTAKKKVDFFTRQYIDALAPSNFALTNPEVFRETVASGGQNLVRGPQQPARRHRARQRPAAHLDDRREGVRARRQHRDDAGQGRVPERADAADPVRADDEEGVEAAAADHAAVDQQVLHPRPAREELVHPLGGRTRA